MAIRSGFKAGKNTSDVFLTPRSIVESLGVFDCDPCSSLVQNYKLATTEYKWPKQDGMMEPWIGRVWCNPPYSEMRRWVRRFLLHGNGILLTPLRLETQWFFDLWFKADGWLIPEGRINYRNEQPKKQGFTNNLWGSIFTACGQDNIEALRQCETGGVLITNREIIPKKYLTLPPDIEVKSSHAKEGIMNDRRNERNPDTSREGSGEGEGKEGGQNHEGEGEEKREGDSQEAKRKDQANLFPD